MHVIEPPSRAINPFSAQCIRPGALRFVFPGACSAKSFVETLERNQMRGQIVGPHGSGKSSFLRAIAAVLELRWLVEFIQISPREPGQSRRPPVAHRHSWVDAEGFASRPAILIVDGFDSLSWLARQHIWWRSRSRKSGLIVTTHRDLGLPTLHQTTLDWPQFVRLVDELTHDNPCRLPVAVIREAFARHQPNIREALFDLYDRFEELRRGR